MVKIPFNKSLKGQKSIQQVNLHGKNPFNKSTYMVKIPFNKSTYMVKIHSTSQLTW